MLDKLQAFRIRHATMESDYGQTGATLHDLKIYGICTNRCEIKIKISKPFVK